MHRDVTRVPAVCFCNTLRMYTPLSGQDPANVPYDASAPLRLQVAQSVAASLRNLRSAYVDCLLLHSPLPRHGDLMEVWRAFLPCVFVTPCMMQVWRAMEAEVERGSVRALGISNCYALPVLQKLWSEAAVKPRVVQNR